MDVANACHRIVEGLHEPSFGAGVAVALAEWIASFGVRTAIQIDFSCRSNRHGEHDEHNVPLDRLPHDLALALFRARRQSARGIGEKRWHQRTRPAAVERRTASRAARRERLMPLPMTLVLLADGHAIVRLGVSQLLIEFGVASEVIEADTGRDAPSKW